MRRALASGLLLCALASSAAPLPETPPGYAVASAHPLATKAGMDVLAAGGNAFDAAVAVSAALAVVEPYSSGIGGGGFWLIHRQKDNLQRVIDGREFAPGAARADMYLDRKGVADPAKSRDGALAAAIPGAPAAWEHLARRYGSRPLAELLQPAIALARDGFAADRKLVQMTAEAGRRLNAEGAAIFPPGLAEGTRVKQPDLARTLEAVARQGRAGFYQGPVAEALVAAVTAGGGIWTLDDLHRYSVIERAPLSVRLRDWKLVTAPPPSAGGVTLTEALTLLEARGWPPADPIAQKHLVIEAWRRAYRDRRELGDPDFVAAPLWRLLSREYLTRLGDDIRLDRATPSAPAAPAPEGDHTTHFSVIDAQGNRVAGTLSINLRFGSGFMAAGTGVLLNDEMDDFSAAPSASNAYGLAGSTANAIAPYKRPLSSMSPSFVEGPRGLLILGTPGGSRIISMVMLGALGFTQGLDAAGIVALPRFHHQFLPDVVEYEPAALSEADRAALERMGHGLKPVPEGYGNMQAIWWDRLGDTLSAGADPRGVGTAEVKRVR